MRFKCAWSRLVTTITIVVLALVGFVFFNFGSSNNSIFFFVSFIVLLGTFAYMPVYIEVTQDALIVKRVLGSLVIHRKDIESIGLCPSQFGFRKFGSGGLFGYLGWFWNRDIGNYFSYSTDENSQILIVTPSRKYVISCENREELLKRFV